MPHRDDNLEDAYPLTGMQQGLLLTSLTSSARDPYIESGAGRLHEHIDVDILGRAWQLVVDATPCLRTAFDWKGSPQALQRVLRSVSAELHTLDWRDATAAELARRTRRYIEEQIAQGFDIERPPLFRFTLIRTGEQDFRVVWVFHHLILDGRSVRRVMESTSQVYRMIRDGKPPRVERDVAFRAHVDWLLEQDFETSQPFWRSTFEGFHPTRLSLPRRSTVSPPPEEPALHEEPGAFHRVWIALSRQDTGRAVELADSLGVTLNTIVQAAWALVLEPLAGGSDVVFGATRACRKSSVPGADSIVGLLMNLVPLRIHWEASQQVDRWLRGIRRDWLELRRWEHTPLSVVRRALDLPGGSPLLQTTVSFESFRLSGVIRSPAGKRVSIKSHLGSGHDVAVYAYADRRLVFNLVVHPQSGDATTAAVLAQRLKAAILAIVNHHDCSVGDLAEELIPQRERRLLSACNDTRAAFDRRSCVHELFEAAAERHPDAPAVLGRGASMSYRRLNQRANKLARYLRRRGLQPGATAGVFWDRHVELATAMLAVLKCGACVVPLDASHPSQRLAIMLRDAKADVLLTRRALLPKTPVTSAEIVVADPAGDEMDARESGNLGVGVKSDDLAYTMYTSGSTGRPKGVDVSHRALVNLVEHARGVPGLDRHDCVIAATTVSFDPAILQLFLPLAVGARVAIAAEGAVHGGAELARCISDHRGTYLLTTPVILRSLREAGWEGEPALRVAYIGEPLSEKLADWLLPRVESLWNAYGPTEATIYCTLQKIERAADVRFIGHPVANTTALVLDGKLRAAPAGVVGELFVGGECLARGYRNQPDLTAASFSDVPGPSTHARQFYHTGDLARWTTDGVLEYLGREDTQVKVNGVRIELAEVQTVLERHRAVSEAVVLAEDDGDGRKQLAGYLVPVGTLDDRQRRAVVEELRRDLLDRLPTAMHPRRFTFVGDVPRTANGKLNRRALPAVARAASAASSQYIAPRTSTERTLAAIISELLPGVRVGVESNLLEIGADSLLVFQASGKAELAGLPVSAEDFFRNPTIMSLAAEIDKRTGAATT